MWVWRVRSSCARRKDTELVDVLALQHDDHIKTMGDTTPLLLDLVDRDALTRKLGGKGVAQPVGVSALR